MSSAFARVISDPSNLILGMICLGMIGLAYHGKTLCKVPRYSSYGIQSSESGEQWRLDADEGLKRLGEETVAIGDPTKHAHWQPPCLPQEAPDYEEKQRKLKELQDDLEKMDVIELAENLAAELPEGKEETVKAKVVDEDVVIEDET